MNKEKQKALQLFQMVQNPGSREEAKVRIKAIRKKAKMGDRKAYNIICALKFLAQENKSSKPVKPVKISSNFVVGKMTKKQKKRYLKINTHADRVARRDTRWKTTSRKQRLFTYKYPEARQIILWRRQKRKMVSSGSRKVLTKRVRGTLQKIKDMAMKNTPGPFTGWKPQPEIEWTQGWNIEKFNEFVNEFKAAAQSQLGPKSIWMKDFGEIMMEIVSVVLIVGEIATAWIPGVGDAVSKAKDTVDEGIALVNKAVSTVKAIASGDPAAILGAIQDVSAAAGVPIPIGQATELVKQAQAGGAEAIAQINKLKDVAIKQAAIAETAVKVIKAEKLNKAATGMLVKAQTGDPKAIGTLVNIERAAKVGSQKAGKKLKVLKAARQGQTERWAVQSRISKGIAEAGKKHKKRLAARQPNIFARIWAALFGGDDAKAAA